MLHFEGVDGVSQYVLTGETTGSNSLSDDVTLPKRADGFPSVSCVAIMYKNVRRFWRLRYNSSFVSAEKRAVLALGLESPSLGLGILRTS